jgi:hypothetical protein
MALPLTLLALTVVAALVAVGFGAALLEQRIGRNTLYAAQAAGAAEAGAAAAVVGEWDAHGLGLLAPGGTAVLPAVVLSGGTAYTPTVIRVNGHLFLVRVTALRRDGGGGVLARREVRLLLRAADSAVPGSPPVRPLLNRAWVPVSMSP